MKSIFKIIALFTVISSLAFSAANDFKFEKRRPDNSADDIKRLPDPAWDTPTNPLFFGWNGTIYVAYQFNFVSGGFKLTSDVIELDAATMPIPAAAETRMYNMETVLASVPVDSAAFQSASDFATAAQGSLANSALQSVSWGDVSGKPTFSTVATTGAYADLSGKPTLFSGSYGDLTGVPSTFTPSAHNQAWSTITSTPTTRAGYGITDAQPTLNGTGFVKASGATITYDNSTYLTAITSGQVTTALGFTPYNATNPNGYTTNTGTVTSVTAGTGLSGGVITGSGTISLPNVVTAGTYGIVTVDAQGRVTGGKRTETYSGTTNASGVYSVTFGTPYSVAPNIIAGLNNGTNTQTWRTTVTTTGFTVTVVNRVDVIGLLPTYSNVNGAAVDVVITEK